MVKFLVALSYSRVLPLPQLCQKPVISVASLLLFLKVFFGGGLWRLLLNFCGGQAEVGVGVVTRASMSLLNHAPAALHVMTDIASLLFAVNGSTGHGLPSVSGDSSDHKYSPC